MPAGRRLRRLPPRGSGEPVTEALGPRWSSWQVWVAAVLVSGVAFGVLAAAEPPKVAIAVAVLPAVLVVLVRPEWLPSLLTVTLFVESLSIGGLVVSRLAGPLALAVVLIRVTSSRWPAFPRRWILWAVAGYVVWAFASILWTVNPDNSLAEGGTGFAIASLALSLSYMAAFAFLVETRDDLRRLGVTVWAVAVIVGLVAILQYVASGYSRAVAYEGDANFFAALQVISIPICVVVASKFTDKRMRAIGFAGVAIIVGSVFASLSRGGLLALVGVIILLAFQPYRFLFRSRSDKKIALIAILIGAGVLFYGAYGDLVARGESLFTTADGGSGRTNLWSAAETGWREHEVRGLGYGAFPSQSNRLLLATPGVNFSAYKLRSTGQVAHSAYVGTLVELGVVGVVLFLGVLVALFRTTLWARRRAIANGDDLVAAAATAMLIAIAGFLMVSVFLSTETDRSLWVMLGFSLALVRIATQAPAEDGR